MTDIPQEDQLTVEDILGEAVDAVQYHTLLEVWQEVIAGSVTVRKERINPQWARRVISAHPQVFYQDMPEYAALYYDKIDQLAEALQAEIETDDECLNRDNPEEDREHNSLHYANVIFSWQKLFLSWELDWDCTSTDAAIELAAIIEVHKMFFGDVGLITVLDQINFEFTESLQEQLFLELEELKSSWIPDE